MKKSLLYFFLLLTSSLLAADFHLSGFGTLGGSISDKEYNYLRFINNEGTLKTNSLVGAQADITLNNQWKITVQAKISPAQDSDSDWDATVPWAFISYRPSNDWLIRVGQIRIPFYLNSQNMDVGITYDIAQLPYEVYSLSPINDGIGAIITKSFEITHGELVVDLFYAKANNQSQRLFVRDDLSLYGGLPKGVNFKEYDVLIQGFATEYKTDENDRFRFGVYKAKTSYNQNEAAYGNFSLQPGISPLPPLYYQSSNSYPSNTIIAFTLGADIGLGDGYRLASEYAIRKIKETDTGPDAQSAYISLSKNIGKWTPYISLAGLKQTMMLTLFTTHSILTPSAQIVNLQTSW